MKYLDWQIKKQTHQKANIRQPKPLTREQSMLNELFNQKNQLWGNGRPVEINHTLSTGNGLIKTGSGDMTRDLFLPPRFKGVVR